MLRFFAGLFMGITTIFSGVVSHTTALITHTANTSSAQVILTDAQVFSMADNRYADGNLPLGDNKYTTTNPQKGYIYLCHANQDGNGGGAQHKGSWIHGNSWNIKEKIAVAGSVYWKDAQFSTTLIGDTRTLVGNDLPTHTTGMFPIALNDPASAYDRNPNTIQAQSFIQNFPSNPTYSDTPYCMGGEAGIMLTGVALFNGFDAALRDAAAYEVQDSCQGHPEKTGEYHYHSLSSCITNVDETTVIGYALDGFPITGSKVAENKYLTTEDLDECHGITSTILLDGKKTTTYHYVMTEDFPYSVSCFRGKPVSLQVISNTNQRQQRTTIHQPLSGVPLQGSVYNSNRPQPPQIALDACSWKDTGVNCSFTSPSGIIRGTCETPPGQTKLACVPSNNLQGQGQTPPQQY